MDFNVIVLCGRLAAPPELRTLDSGSRLLRLLLAIESSIPRSRVDAIPVHHWDPPQELIDELPEPGGVVWAAGSLQRRFIDAPGARRSRLEVIAHHVEAGPG